MIRKVSVVIFSICFLFLGLTQAKTSKPVLVVLPMSGNINESLLKTFDGAIENRIPPDTYQVVGSNDLRSLISLEKMKDLAGCDNVTCFAEISGALSADFIVSGTANVVGDELVLNLLLMDAHLMLSKKRLFERIEADETLYLDTLIGVVDQLFDVSQDSELTPEDMVPNPKPEGCEALNVDYTHTTTEIANDYNWSAQEIKDGSFKATPRSKGKVLREACWFKFDHDVSTVEAQKRIESGGIFLVADLWELSAFSHTKPSLQSRSFPFIALGSVWRDHKGDPYIPTLPGGSGSRGLNLSWSKGSDWFSNVRFLAIKAIHK